MKEGLSNVHTSFSGTCRAPWPLEPLPRPAIRWVHIRDGEHLEGKREGKGKLLMTVASLQQRPRSTLSDLHPHTHASCCKRASSQALCTLHACKAVKSGNWG